MTETRRMAIRQGELHTYWKQLESVKIEGRVDRPRDPSIKFRRPYNRGIPLCSARSTCRIRDALQHLSLLRYTRMLIRYVEMSANYCS
jgi:hypothetical protein